ncbi:MAG: MFS transporter [Candidatus Bathyarchaeota archaeon]|nr:MFS transporter [Candidatus Bathyarchaeota archaeon]MDH5787328.1 MFS transporter [Candidatus Bathyarchaeota archaeon]
MAMIRRGLFYTFLTLYLNKILGLSVTETTLLASITMIANSASQTLVWGKLSDKYQARASLVVIGETVAALGYGLLYFVHIYLLNESGPFAAAYSIIAGLSILEFFWSMSNLGWSALVSDVSTSKERGRLMSVISCIGGVGHILGVTVSAPLYDWGGKAGGFTSGLLFFFPAGIMLVSAAIIWFSTHKLERIQEEGLADEAILKQNVPLSQTHTSRTFYWFLVSIFIVGLGISSILQILLLYVDLESPIGATSFDISMIRNSASVATIVISLLAGSIADKIGRKNALGIGFVLSVVTPILYIFAQDAVQIIVINSLSGISNALRNVVGYLLVADLIPAERRGRLFGQYNAVTYISFGIAGTLLGGPTADYLIGTGLTKAAAFVTTFQVASAVSVIGTIVFALKVRPDRN